MSFLVNALGIYQLENGKFCEITTLQDQYAAGALDPPEVPFNVYVWDRVMGICVDDPDLNITEAASGQEDFCPCNGGVDKGCGNCGWCQICNARVKGNIYSTHSWGHTLTSMQRSKESDEENLPLDPNSEDFPF
jgi:hypothetical protein